MLDKHFDESSHREVYLGLLGTDDERSRIVAAVGLSATGEAGDHRVLLSEMSGAGSKGRRRLLGAAASLDYEGSRSAMFEALGHGLRGVSNAARRLLAEHMMDAEADVLAELLGNEYAHVCSNALLLAAHLGHWLALPLILRGTTDCDGENVETAKRLVDSCWPGTSTVSIASRIPPPLRRRRFAPSWPRAGQCWSRRQSRISSARW